ncbi:MAG: hypothetical protein GY795_41460 [Desulfobacterales bacterium]|nr:hypothetical protein [Desulfobacterales bacterium]
MNKPDIRISELGKQEIENRKSQLAKKFKEVIFAMGSHSDKIKSIARQVSKTTQRNNKKRLKDIQSIYERNLQNARDTYTQTCESLQKQIEKIKSGFDYQQKEWTDPSWRVFESPEFLNSHQLIRIGAIHKRTAYGEVEMPLLLPVMGHNNVLIKASGDHKEKAIRLLQTIAMRILVSIPAGKLKFTFIDPVGHGKNFGRFAELPDTIFEGRIWGEKHHIHDKLADFSEHIRLVNQVYLRGDKFKNIEEYNKEMKIINEPYRVLVVSDFPEGFDTDTARRLLSIADNGVRTGVYLLVMMDIGKKNPYDFSLYDLERKCLNLVYNSNGFLRWIDSPLPDCELHTDSLPDENILDRIIRQISRASEKIEQVKLPFKGMITELLDQMWKGDASEELSVPIGKSGVRTQYFSIGDKEHHALITGKIGKGKSIFLHNLIISMALHYSPNELEFYLIDLKEGVEFNRYAEYQLPHARAVGIETEREFAFSILKKLDMEFKRRLELFKDTDSKITKLFHYNEKRPESKLPRIVLIVDEFQRLFTENDNMSEEISQVLDILVKQARNAGINIIMASQVLDRAIFSKRTETQMGIRVAFQCSEDESRIILGEGNTEAATLKRPGEGIYNDDNRRIEKNSRFQASWLSEDDSVEYLLQIQEEAQKHAYESQDRLIVFDGRKPGTILNNNKFMNIINEPAWHEPPKICYAWMGESISIKPDTCASFKRQGGSNLLLVGMNDTAILSMIFASILSITAQQSRNMLNFILLILLVKTIPILNSFLKSISY